MTERAWPKHLVAVAEVLCPQGNRGEVKVLPLTGRPERFAALSTVTAWRDGRERVLTLTGWRPWRQFVILGFAELTGIDDAESLRGALICVQAAERAPLPPGEYYHDDLIGLAVATERGRPLGRVTSIVATGANDVLVARDETGREILIPAVKAVVVQVDLAAGTIIIRELPGLLPDSPA